VRADFRSLPTLILGLCLVGAALLIFNLWSLHSIADDAYISFRYLDHWLAGHGLVYNPGERVEGYTNFLWIVLLAPLRAAGLEPEVASVLLSLATLPVLFWAVFRTASSLANSRDAGWAAVLLLSGCASLARWAVSGMETVLFAVLLALANERLTARRQHNPASSLAFGLSVLTRPPGALHAALAFTAAVFGRGAEEPRRLRPLVGPVLLFLMFPLAQLVFRLAYYGAPLPNSAYVKLIGEPSILIPGGLAYLWAFLTSGGWTVLAATALVAISRVARSWIILALIAQVVGHFSYVVWVGGDYFPFHRFLVPALPALAVLGGVGLQATVERVGLRARWVPIAALALALLQTAQAHRSSQRVAFDSVVTTRREREQVAEWLEAHAPEDATLAINAAGLIPYRTGLVAIDMLGLNDRHIARARKTRVNDGGRFVGHFAYDGAYVCDRRPDVVVTSGARLHPGRSSEEAVLQASLNTFAGDREFLRAPECRDRYRPVSEELAPGRFLVVYFRQDEPAGDAASPPAPSTAEGWFRQGLDLMRGARLEEAIHSFERSLELSPDNPVTRTNLGFCLLDLDRYPQAIAVFEEVLRRAPRHFDALYGLALAHEKLGHRIQAIDLWRRYVQDAPESTWKEEARGRLSSLARSPP
jgi:hypothetical protein